MEQQFTTINLNSNWEVAQYESTAPDRELPNGELTWIPARVPGAIQYDLICAGLLENPYASSKAAFDAAWVAKSDWIYRTEFAIPFDKLGKGRFILKVNGIDTFSEIWLNGQLLGETANAYRIYEFPVASSLLKESSNLLMIRVKAHTRMIEPRLEAAKRLRRDDNVEGLLGKSLIRRYQRSFYSGSSLLNLGTAVLGIGINRPIELLFFPGTRIIDCYYKTLELNDNSAKGELSISLDFASEASTHIQVSIIDADGSKICEFGEDVRENEVKIPITIEHPRLWWPVGYGKPELYTLVVRVYDRESCIHEARQKIGIKTVELVTTLPNGRKTFYFRINGKRIYVRGHNLIPLDYIKVYREKEEYERLFVMLQNSNANLVRIWGGGALESQDFYERCDELGIMVWQECFLHSNVYPDYDEEFVQEFKAESEGIIRQVRKHVSLCIICGGNELQEGWDEWGWKDEIDTFYGESLVRELLPKLTEELCPEIPYIYNSPHGGKWAQSPVEGECHNWGNFYNSTKDPLFVTETCWTTESYSRPETLKKYMGLDVEGFNHLRWFERWHEITLLPRINRLPYSNWFDVSSLKNYLHSLEIEQAGADYNAISMLRLRSPPCNGIVYWSFNKGGPLFQFGCVDYDGYPMMSYYVVKRLFEKIVVGAYRDISDIHVVVSNESGDHLRVFLEVYHLDASGKQLGKWVKLLKYEAASAAAHWRLYDTLVFNKHVSKVFSLKNSESTLIRKY